MNEPVHQLLNRGLGDAKVRSISWAEDDLVVAVVLPGRSDEVRHLRFKWVTHLTIHLEYNTYGGQPLIFSVDTREGDGQQWLVSLVFGAAPDGEISFQCDDIEVS